MTDSTLREDIASMFTEEGEHFENKLDRIEALFTAHEKALLERIEAALPKELEVDVKDRTHTKWVNVGFNQALADVRTIIGGLR